MQKTSFQLRPSHKLFLWLVMIHGGMAILLPTMPMPWWVCIGLALIIVAHFMYVSRRYVSLQHRDAIIEIQKLTAAEWRLKTRAGREYTALLQGDSFIQPYLIVLVFKHSKSKRRVSVAIFPDSLSPSDFRALRILLLKKK